MHFVFECSQKHLRESHFLCQYLIVLCIGLLRSQVKARKIKTYDISIRPYEDCCTVFVPEHPVIKPSIEEALLEESKCNLDPLIEEAVINIETIELNDKDKYSVFKDKFDI